MLVRSRLHPLPRTPLLPRPSHLLNWIISASRRMFQRQINWKHPSSRPRRIRHLQVRILALYSTAQALISHPRP
ncbi:hypothetical protein BT96DRAFT_4788 [Gymnopus androsaceus JB14]|uniref:Uncharacterized protein n=1 Tax=Gymnopus androsaceus JB14 TaxID=1447944 RepID=A0A6A4IRB4_9AGAR|nr:hypothetical protein BT96DRAFT_4788 [Gymnopus androsaceus JB14]